jgi:hypothetical protein
MYLKNTSRYDIEEIKDLLVYAADGFDLRGVAVNVKNCSRGYAGRAYSDVPGISNVHPKATRLVVIRIGTPGKFPISNFIRKLGHPYGGKTSPLIEMQNWREALVAVAAHEFCHIHQFQNKLPRSEIQCEKAAAKRLDAYRGRNQ